ncbi:iron-containing alcohol dehydrogenase [Treponema sp. OMZ 840]|uniref:iron-containing alcohol dehydrogenase n=1 Tax=Treponema sp. OMZ 840 TaxID=244313 RepID=UPI003D8B566E
MADFIFRISPNIVLGSYSSSRVGQFIRDWGHRFLLIVDPVLHEFGIIEKIDQSLKDRNIDFIVFDEISSTPDTALVEQALKLARDARVHGLITIGGMKIANIGKTVCALFDEEKNIYDFTEGALPAEEALPYICIPTTASNGFLFVDKAPIIDARTGQLKIIKLQPGLCRLAVFDPNLVVSLTENQFISMTLQTVCIAVEAYISQKANFFSDTIIEKAVELLGYALSGSSALLTAAPKEQFAVEGGCMASLGAASSSNGVGTFLSHAVSARYKISPSLVSTILLPHIIEDAAKFKAERLAKLAKILKMAPDTSSNDNAVALFVEAVRNKIALFNLPARLKDLSVSIEQLALCVDDLGKLGAAIDFHRSLAEDDLFDIIKRAF